MPHNVLSQVLDKSHRYSSCHNDWQAFLPLRAASHVTQAD